MNNISAIKVCIYLHARLSEISLDYYKVVDKVTE